MSDTSNTDDGAAAAANANAGAADPAAGPPQYRLAAQYAKDLSFESPRPPAQLPNTIGGPTIDLSVNVNAQSLDSERNRFEVELTIEARAKKDEEIVFIAEVVYAGVMDLTNVSDALKAPITLIECPRLLFPFARRIVADMVRDGGFPPFLIEPIDFVALYRRHMTEVGAQNGSEPTESPG